MKIYNQPELTNFKGSLDRNVIIAVKRARDRAIADVHDTTSITPAIAKQKIISIKSETKNIILQLTEILKKYHPDTVLQMTYNSKRINYALLDIKKWLDSHNYELFGHIKTFEEIEELFKPEELVLVNEKYGTKEIIKSARVLNLDDFKSVISLFQNREPVDAESIQTFKNNSKKLIDEKVNIIKKNIKKLNLEKNSQNIKDVSKIKIIIWEIKTYKKILKQIKTIEKSAKIYDIKFEPDTLYAELKKTHQANVDGFRLFK